MSAFYAAAWRVAPIVRPRRWPVHRALAPLLREPVVEVGPGAFPRSDAADTVWVEPSEAVASRLRATGRVVHVGRAEALPLPDSSFETALLLDVLEHCDDDRAALAELARVLRPGGRLILAVPLGAVYWSVLDPVVGHTFRYDPDDLLAKLDAAGFVPELARVTVPIAPWTKRLADAGLWLGISVLGVAAATAAKGFAAELVPVRWTGRPLQPFTGISPRASRVMLACRRRPAERQDPGRPATRPTCRPRP
jgi:SAM-dependent methyltransferase